MAKILFVQNLPFEYVGPMSISAVLKERGHQCRLVIVGDDRRYLETIAEYNPDLIGFSTMTGPHRWVLKIAEEIKGRFTAPIILGGPHPTFFPEIIRETSVDMICLGEGEFAVLDVADRMDRGEDYSSVQNLWVKKDGRVIQNGLRPLIDNLDALPFPDRALYDHCAILRAVPAMKFLTGRGCPYRCTFCFNHKFNELYRGLGRVVRKRSVASLVEEIQKTAKKYGLRLIRFPDDTFSGNRRWLLEFLRKYKDEVRLPFTALAHANELDEETIRSLKSAGCLNIYFGVETGNEGLRNHVLNKNLTNRRIMETARLLRKHRLKFGTYNMFGIPQESLASAFETIAFNRKLKPNYTINNIFQPYPRTEIADLAAAQGLIDPQTEYLDTMNEGSLLRLKEIDRIVNLCRFATLAISFPILTPLIKGLIRLPPNRVFKIIFDVSSAPAMQSNLNLDLITLLKWGLRLRKIH
jgi:anaerobic magnesium-protoporphyrin IX monomethyl ester cyclase